jgi:hypothetical protein
LILIGYAGNLQELLPKGVFDIKALNALRQKISQSPHFEKKIMLHTAENTPPLRGSQSVSSGGGL